MARSLRLLPTKVMIQLSSVEMRFLKPTIAMRCTASHASQAMKPVSLILPMLATAEYFEIVAIEPLSL